MQGGGGGGPSNRCLGSDPHPGALDINAMLVTFPVLDGPAIRNVQKRRDVHRIVWSIKSRFPLPPGLSASFEGFLLICTVFPHFGPFSGRVGVKPNFADKNFMDTQTFLKRESGRFARIDSQKNPHFHNVQGIRANHLKHAIRIF